jgi:hypothetical protein
MEGRRHDSQDPHGGGPTSEPADWALALARQADADFRAWELYELHPEAVAAECHKLLFLQMACEKLCKAHLIQGGTPPEALQADHGYIANPLPIVVRQQIIAARPNLHGMRGVLNLVRHLAGAIEVLNPAMRRDGLRPDNCEYPWEAGDQVISPLDWTFHPLRLVTAPAGRTFIKLLRGAIDRIIDDLEH